MTLHQDLFEEIPSDPDELATPSAFDIQIRQIWGRMEKIRNDPSFPDVYKAAELAMLMELQNKMCVECQRAHERQTKEFLDSLHLQQIGAAAYVTGGVRAVVKRFPSKIQDNSIKSYYEDRIFELSEQISNLAHKEGRTQREDALLVELQEELRTANEGLAELSVIDVHTA